MQVLYHWEDPSLVSSAFHDNTYNEIWGYDKDGREYAIIGSTAGTHIFDITDIGNVDTVDFIPGKVQGISIVHRDYHTYADHLYMVADEGPSSLQIADLSYLPDSVHLVYDEDSLIIRSHNIFIDSSSGRLYTCGGTTNLGAGRLSIYDIATNPAEPQFLLNCNNSVSFWNQVGYVHDVYVQNDTAWCHAEGRGMFVVDFNDLANPALLGSITSYPDKGYNHSGWLNADGDVYAMADENHGFDVKVLDVSDLSNITVTSTFSTNVVPSISIPHNLLFLGNDLYASYYFDGLYVFDVSDPANVSVKGYYDTSQRPHRNGFYEGCWGVYPFLPSGHIIASDMQEGLFVFNTPVVSGIEEEKEFHFASFPNPATDQINLITVKNEGEAEFALIDMEGSIVKSGSFMGSQGSISVQDLESGLYLLRMNDEFGRASSRKIILK